ncbi:voltage-gated potassium channel [Aureococcus anophagefferens]|nr:voltage-gated potassium channel [Aureococcus anophagefferens]
MSYAPIDAPPRRAGRVALVAVAAGLLVAGALYPHTAAPPLALATAAAKTTVALTYADFLAVDEVCKYVRQQEGEDCYDVAAATLLNYVPRRVELTVDRALVEGSVGAQAAEGYVAFNIVWMDESDEEFSSWLVVLDYAGAIRTMVPFYEGKSLSTASINIHDLQKAKDGSAFWSAIKSEEIQKTCVDTNKACADSTTSAIAGVPSKDVDDINHVQPIEDDAKIVISSRSTNAIYKVWASNMTKIWALGGDDGDFAQREYVGDDEYAMFDNNYDRAQRNSRLLVVEAADGAANASVVWEYDVGVYSQMFGDNDRLPTGNMFACWWPSETINGSDAYEARVAEITRSTMETAFQLDIFGKETPLVWDVACDGRDLSFKVANNFKQASAYDGTYAATSAKGTRSRGRLRRALAREKVTATQRLRHDGPRGALDYGAAFGALAGDGDARELLSQLKTERASVVRAFGVGDEDAALACAALRPHLHRLLASLKAAGPALDGCGAGVTCAWTSPLEAADKKGGTASDEALARKLQDELDEPPPPAYDAPATPRLSDEELARKLQAELNAS